MIDEDELIKFLQWYWKEIGGRPGYQTTANEIVNFYLDDLRNEKEDKQNRD